jgi:hypothetical protein
MKVLEERLTKRGTETPEKIALRLKNAADEIKYSEVKGNFDMVMVNNDLEESFQKLSQQLNLWYPSVKMGHGDIETPEQFLIRVGLGQYVGAFLKFGVETMEDVATSAKLLSDDELSNELGMSDRHIAHFREIFEDDDEEEDGTEDEQDDEDDEDL